MVSPIHFSGKLVSCVPCLWTALDQEGRVGSSRQHASPGTALWIPEVPLGGVRGRFLCYLELNFGSMKPFLLTVPNLKTTNQAASPQSRYLTREEESLFGALRYRGLCWMQ